MSNANGSIQRDRVSANKLYVSGTTYLAPGSVEKPAINFKADTDTGIYKPDNGIVGFASNGVGVLEVSETAVNTEVPITSSHNIDLIPGPGGNINVHGANIVGAGSFVVQEFGAESILVEDHADFADLNVPPDNPSAGTLRMYYDGRLRYLDEFSNHIVVAQDTTDTLTNKTIMASNGNTIDANYIKGIPITGAPSNGTFLRKNLTSWEGVNITGSGPITATGTGDLTIGANVGSSANTLCAGDDGRLETINKLYVKAANPGPGEFTSVVSALAAVVNPTQTSPWLIEVGPGTYVENALTVPSNVTVMGCGVGVTILTPATDAPLFTVAANARVHTMSLYGRGTGTDVAFALHSCEYVILNNLSVTGFGNVFQVSAATTFSDVILFDSMIFPPYSTAVNIDGTALTSNYPCTFTVTVTSFASNNTGTTFNVAGPNAVLKLANSEISLAATGISVSDGAKLVYQSSQIHNCGVALSVPNVGAAPDVKTSGVTIFDCTADINIAHPNTTGVFNGVAARSKVTVDPSAPICLTYTDPEVNASVIVGDFVYSPFNGGVLTETGESFVYTSPLGAYTGGGLSAAGLVITIGAGSGYVSSGAYPTGQLLKLEWAQSNLTLTANGVFYIYIDNNGDSAYSSSLPSTTNTVVLGRVITGASAVEIIDPQQYNSLHSTEANKAMLRNAVGALYSSGSVVTADGSRQISVSSGKYYYLSNEINTTGKDSTAAYTAYYHSGGAWTNASETIVSNTNYDNGTDLAAIPTGNFVKHALYTVGKGVYEKYLLVYGQTLFADQNSATVGVIPTPPNYFSEGIIPLANIIVQQGVTNVIDIIDTRPRLAGSAGASFGAVTDHGNLTGLLDDDHPQYLLDNGTRPMSGQLDMGTNPIINATSYNGVNITAHAARHLPNGADALATAAPLTTLSTATTNTVGTANSFARSDHTHAFDQSTIAINSIGGTLEVAKGGTGATTLTAGNFLQGNGTLAVTATKVVPAGDVVGTTDAQTLANKTLTTPVISTVVNTGTLTLPTSTDTLVGRATVDTLTNKTLTLPVITQISNGGVLTLPSGPETLVGRSTVDTLTNKTLTTPVISTIINGAGTLTLPTVTDVLVGRATIDTLTNKTLTLPVIAQISNGGVLTLPTSTDTLVGRATTDTLTNKTLTTPVISTIINGAGTLTLPTVTDVLVGRATIDTLSNKTIQGAVFVSGTTAQVSVNSGGTAGTSTNLVFGQTADRNITFPDATDTLVGLATADTLTNKTLTLPVIAQISNGGVLTLPTSTDTLVGRDTTDTLTNKTLVAPVITNGGTITIPTGPETLVGRDTVDTLTNKTLTAPVISTIMNGTGTLTLPTSTDTLVGLATTDTLTNKTLTAPVISTISNGGTLTLPTSTDTLVGRDTTDTLTNKILVDNSTTIMSANDNTKKLVFFINGGGGFTTTIATNAISNCTYNIPSTGGTSGQFIMDSSAQTIGGVKTFTDNLHANVSSNTPDIRTSRNVNTKNRKLVLWDGNVDNDHQYYGFGTAVSVLRCQLANTVSDVVFYAANNSTSSNEVFRVKGTGGIATPSININSSSTTGADMLFPNVIKNRKISLWQNQDNDHEYYGFGVNGNMSRYQVANTTSDHVFYAAANSTSSNEVLRIKGSGGIILPTPGGIGSILNSYEEYTSSGATVSGPWSSPQPVQVRLTRTQKTVTMYMGNDSTGAVTASNTVIKNITLSVTFGNQWRPVAGLVYMMIPVLNTTNMDPGYVRIDSNGVVTIGALSTTGNFNGGGTVGFWNFGVSWNCKSG